MRLDPGDHAARKDRLARCAVVSRGEMAQLRKVGEIVRLGRVRTIEPSRIVLEKGELAADPDTLYIDCTASAIQPFLYRSESSRRTGSPLSNPVLAELI